MQTIHRTALVAYSGAQMYALVADVEAYPRFLPWCGGARVLTREDDTTTAAIDIAYHGVSRSFTTRNLHQPDKMIEIRLLDGPFRFLDGRWQFQTLSENACKVVLDLQFEVASRLVSVVLTPVFTAIANQLVDAFHDRARALYGADAGAGVYSNSSTRSS